jgi:hypothetical protein
MAKAAPPFPKGGGAALSKIVYVYDQEDILVGSYSSHTEAAFLDCSIRRVGQLVQTGGRTRKGYRVSSTPLSS